MIRVEDLTVQAGTFRLENISFELPEGQCGVLMGRTGCGKTTLLEAICGLKVVRSGTVSLMDRDVTALSPGERNIGFMPQDISLFANMTVKEHLAFGPTVRKWRRRDRRERIEELAEGLGITDLLKRRPQGLSGGERQRVALGRALSIRPKVLCLDEPLSALDDDTHTEISALIKRMLKNEKVTALHITHSRKEAEFFADYLFKMAGGRLSLQRAPMEHSSGGEDDDDPLKDTRPLPV